MGQQIVIPNDVLVQGTLTATTNVPSASTVNDAKVAAYAGTGSGVQASKLQQRFQPCYAQPGASSSADEQKIIHVVRGTAGSILAFKAGAVAVLVGDDTCTVDLKKNGTTVLSAPISLASSDTNRVAKTGTLSVSTLVAGDVLEVFVDVTHSTGTLPKGVFASVELQEDPA